MDYRKRQVRLSLEPLEARDVPALLGPVVALPYPAAPTAEVALTAPHDLGQDIEASIKIDKSDLKAAHGQGGETSTSSDSASALKIQFQDIHFTRVKLTDVLISSAVSANDEGQKLEHGPSKGGETNMPSDAADALKVTFQDISITQTVSKATPKLFL